MTPTVAGESTRAWISLLALERVVAERRAAAQTRYFSTLAEINRTIIRAPDQQRLFRDVCRVIVETGGYVGVAICQSDSGRMVRVNESAGELTSLFAQLGLDLDDHMATNPTAAALRDGSTTWLPNLADHPDAGPWRSLMHRYEVRSAAVIPLHRHGAPVAALALFSSNPSSFETNMREFVSQVADNVSFALDGIAAREEITRIAEQRADLLRRLVIAQENERSRIADDLHDESVQTLAAVDLRLGILKSRVRDKAAELEPSVQVLQETVRATAESLRDLLFELEPGQAEEALDVLVRGAAEQAFGAPNAPPVRWHLIAQGSLSTRQEIKVQAHRIVKEALINVRKHAQAANVEILLSGKDGYLDVVVTDDGVGLGDSPRRTNSRHRGLTSMSDRAESMGGWCRVESPAAAGGTVVMAKFPLGSQAPTWP